MGIFEDFSLSMILHEFGQIMKIPCVVILLALIIVAVWQIGDLIMELILERRKREKNIEVLLDSIRNKDREEIADAISASMIPAVEKKMLKKLVESDEFEENDRKIMAVKYLDDEEARFEKKTAVPELLAKLGPMFGLLGTLIPLGPGIVALGQGDTATLSNAIGLAFDTTIAGLLTAAVGSIISNIRNRWYDGYMSDFETLMEVVLEEVNK